MSKTRKCLILSLFLCLSMVLTPGIESNAENPSGEQAASASGLEDENPQRLEETTAMDEDGNIRTLDEEEVSEEVTADAPQMIALDIIQVVNLGANGNKVINYKEYGTGVSGYTNGAYGADAAYLGTKNGKVRFMISGVVGEIDEGSVQLLGFSSAKSVSCYKVSEGRLLHYITQNMSTEGHATSLDNGPAPSYLQGGVTYYSYDGHYFYTDYGTMLSDYRNENRSRSVNPDDPYYNYYQYLPLRSTAAYGADELNGAINGRVSASSKMRDIGGILAKYQQTYGINALIMAGVAANESGWGKSNICQTKNNLFGLNAVDSSPGTSANTYASVDECIRQFADGWMSRGYLDTTDWRYKGGFLGNKASGINVSYASDPYWGEKAANIIRALDGAAGGRDEGAYTLGIKDTLATSHTSVNVRSGSSTSSAVLYKTNVYSNYAVKLLSGEAENSFYKIQSDPVLKAGRTGVETATGVYDFDSMYAYISANYITIVNQGGKTEEPETPPPEPVEPDEPETAPPAPEVQQPDTTAPAPETQQQPEAAAPTPETTTKPEATTPTPGTATQPEVTSPQPETTTTPGTTAKPETTTAPETTTKPESPEPTPETTTKPETTEPKPETATQPETTAKPETAAPAQGTTAAQETNQPETSGTEPVEKKDKDKDTGIWVSGALKDENTLSVKKIAPDNAGYGVYVEPVKNCTILGVYDISVKDLAKGESVELGFPVKGQKDGQKVIVVHIVDGGKPEIYHAKVKDEKVTIKVTGFSPYVIALDDAGAAAQTAQDGRKAVKTGDYNSLMIWIFLLAASAMTAGYGVYRKRRL